MGNVIKYTTTPVNNSIKKGNFALGINDIDYGPTNITGFYSTTIPSTSGYTVYNENGGTLSYESVSGTTPLINYLSNKRGVSMTTAGESLSWAAGQSNIFVTNREYENIVTSGMVLNLDAGFVSSYPTSATTWYDLSYSGNNGTLTNGPTFSSLSGGSIVFDGVDDYVNCGNSTSLNLVSGLTIFSVYKLNGLPSVTGNPNIVDKWDWPNNLRSFSMGTESGKFSSRISPNGTFDSSLSFFSENTPKIGGYYFQVLTYDGQTGVMYLNELPSVNKFGTQNNIFSSVSTEIWVGRSRDSGQGGRWISADIYTTQIYNRALSPFEVYQNYNSMKGRFGIPDIVTSGLTLNLDAGNPYSYNPLNTGSTTWVNTTNITSGGTLTNGTFYSGGTMVFDGVDDYVIDDTPNNINLSQPCSINTWVLFNSFNSVLGNSRVIECQDSSNSIQLSRDESTGKIATKNSNFQSGVNGNTWFTPTTNVWYNISVVWTPSTSTTQLYLNGLIQTGSTFNNIGIGDKPNKITLGVRSDFVSTWLNGKIGNVQIYNRALSASEVQQNFNALRGRYGI
jgi:hypothetical protein